jgi:hypothetical protein
MTGLGDYADYMLLANVEPPLPKLVGAALTPK